MVDQPSFDPYMFLAHVGAGRTIAAYQPQRPIFAQGDVADAVFYIQSGQVKLTVVSARGKEAVIAILESRAFFGEGCLAGQPRRISTATALTDCSLMRIEKSAMIHVLHAEPAFAALFTAYLLSRNSRIEEDLIDPHSIGFRGESLSSFTMRLKLYGVTSMLGRPRQRPNDLGVAYAPASQSDTRKPDHHRRFSA